jgi:hypothetical protein
MVDRQKVAKEFVTAWADYESIITGAFTEAQKDASKDGRLHQAIGILSNSDEFKTTDSRRRIAMHLALHEVFK